MNEAQLKPLLLRDKEFLKDLYSSGSSSRSKTILNFASDLKLNTLLKVLHTISNGRIKIKKEVFQQLNQRQLNFIRKNFESKAEIQNLLMKDRKCKLEILSKIASIYNILLHPLFNM